MRRIISSFFALSFVFAASLDATPRISTPKEIVVVVGSKVKDVVREAGLRAGSSEFRKQEGAHRLTVPTERGRWNFAALGECAWTGTAVLGV